MVVMRLPRFLSDFKNIITAMADFSNAISDFFAAHGAYCRCAKRSVSEMENTAFWCGIGAGMVLGAAVGMAVSPRQRSMKTCVGRTMQHMGNAVDNAWEDFLHAIE
jgi:hypothetical protein